MSTKIILCASKEKLIAGRWRSGSLEHHIVFANDENGLNNFRQFLQANINFSTYMLVDTQEEDYRPEQLPHTVGATKQQIIQRKLDQLFRTAEYRAAVWLEREKVGRRDDKYLFVALSNSDMIQHWMSAIIEARTQLVGVYLLAMVGQHIIKKLKNTESHLLLCERLSSGLRQTYYQSGHLRLSRVAPIDEDDATRLAYFYTVESERTKLYLISQRYITRDVELAMLMPPHDDPQQNISQAVQQENNINCRTYDFAPFSRGLKIGYSQLAELPELLHMHLAANGAIPANLAPASFAKPYRIGLIRKSILAATAIITLAALGLSAYFWMQHRSHLYGIQEALAGTIKQEALYHEEAKNFPQAPVTSTDLQTAVEANHTIVQNAKTPLRMMQHISVGIAEIPEIKLTRMHWALSSDPDPKDGDDKSVITTPTDAPNPSIGVAFTREANQLYEIAFVNGELRDFSGDYRAALASVNQFADKLRADPQIVEVKILQVPVNVSSYTTLQGTTADETQNSSRQAMFKLRVTLKREGIKP